jgi:uncharacterized SAM-binding protein YcdF (DUF218 family)
VATFLLALLVIAATMGISLVATTLRVVRFARAAPAGATPGRARWAVVLGAPLSGAEPGPAFRARLDRAAALATAHPGLCVAVLGGVSRRGAQAEAAVGLAHLAAAGLDPDRLLAEPRSRHTLENLSELRRARPEASVALLLVTSRSHLARAMAMAEGLGLNATPVAAETLPPPVWQALPRFLVEGFLLHWYLVGRGFARLTANRRMLSRIS